MGRKGLPIVLLGFAVLSTGVASAAPVYDVDVTYLSPVLTVAGEEVRADALTVPVPTGIKNTPRTFLEDAGANGVPLAQRAAGALPDDEYVVDVSSEWRIVTLRTGDLVALLPDGDLQVVGYDAQDGRASAQIRFYVRALAEQGLYTEPVFTVTPGADLDQYAHLLATDALAAHGTLTPHDAPPVPDHGALPATAAPADEPEGGADTHTPDGGALETSTSTRAAPFGGDLRATAVQAAAAAAALALPALLGWALYHRIRGHTHLNQATRKAIYDAVTAHPGAGVNDVARAASVSYSTASYHLDRLTSAKLLVVTGAGTRLRYYKNGGLLNDQERQLHELFENDAAMRVLAAIRDQPGTYRAALAESLGVTPTTVNWHLKRLRDLGLVKEQRQGRSAALFVDAPRAREAAAPLLEKVEPTAEMRRARALLLGDAAATPAQPVHA